MLKLVLPEPLAGVSRTQLIFTFSPEENETVS